MANSGNKKARNVKNTGSVYYDNSTEQWVGQVEIGKYSNGRTKFKRFYGKSQNAVIDKMRDYKQANVGIISDDIQKKSNIFVSDFFINYLQTVKKTKLKPSSFTRDKQILNNQIIPYLGQYDLSKLSPQIIQVEMINDMIDKGYSYSSIHKSYVLLNEGLRYAYKQGIIPNNPCDLVEKPSKKIFTNTKEIRFFNDDEINRFKESALLVDEKTGDYHYRNGLALLSIIYTGLRIGELMTLKWSDVDLENGFLRVHSNSVVAYDDDNKRKIIIQDSTKTKKSRIVHLTKSAKFCFNTIKETYTPKPNDYVYYIQGSRDARRAIQTYEYICQRAGIENPQGAHTLRHTCASLLIRKGVDIKIISEMLGHSSVSFTYNTYVHLIEEEKAKVIKEIDI